MPSIRYYNQTAPFWDFVASMEDNSKREESTSNEHENSNSWDGAWAPAFGPFGFRGRHGHGPRDRHSHGAPPQGDHDMTSGEEKDHDPEAGPSEPHGPPPPFSEKSDHDHPHGQGHGHHRGGPGGFRGRCAGGRGGRGAWVGRGRWGPGGPMGGLNNLAELFQSQLFGDGPGKTSDDFRPDVDVFDTPAAFVVHVALPGAKKEDVGVNWDAEKSELAIAGVVHRPGDEEFLKTLALDERKVGAFERKVRLGSRANPAQVDIEGITARMEDGVLRIEVPKMDGGFVEIRKVDIM